MMTKENGKKKKNVDWRRLNEIFGAAVELDPAAQKEFLRNVWDENLRAEAEAMLAAMRRAEKKDFLENDAFRLGARILAENEDLGQKQIGNYRLVREIGRGGMGRVFLATREDFHQNVALKIIKRGMDSDEIIRRFLLERQVLASLNHPFIARLLDGGTTPDGLPYFVMEYVEGESITEFCDRRKLNIEERLALFRKVCAAVSYAHQNLIVHRDIKPSNILVTEKGEPKLLDFGISKLLDGEAFGTTIEQTATGARLMTPEYASPEQIRGEKITTASDIYSLGILLYELLSGHRPFRLKNRSSVEIIKIVSDEEPSAPSTAVVTTEEVVLEKDTKKILSPATVAESRCERPERLRRRLQGDLDNIVLMSLSKEPARRYQTVEQFAEDVRRHLDALPVLARPATFAYQVSKFVQRNRASATFATFALVALLTGLSVAVWQAYVAREERARAERQLNKVRELANSLLTEYDEEIGNLPGSSAVLLKLAEASSDYLDGLTQETSDPALLKELAQAHYHLGENYAFSLSDLGEAQKHYQQAIDISRKLLDAAPGDLETKRLLAKCLSPSWRGFPGWRENFREVVRLREEIAAAKPDDLESLDDLSSAYMGLGDVLSDSENHEESSDYFRRAIEIRRRQIKLLEKPDRSAEEYDALFTANLWIGIIHAHDFRDWQTALTNFRSLAEIADTAAASFPDHRVSQTNVHLAHSWLAKSLAENGDYPAALEQYQISLRSLKETAVRYNIFAHQTEAKYKLKVAEILLKTGQNEPALVVVKDALEIRRQATEVDKANPRAYHSHAFVFSEAGKLLASAQKADEALIAYSEAEKSWQKALEANPKDAEIRLSLATLYSRIGDLQASFKPDSMETQSNKKPSLQKAGDWYKKAVQLFTEIQNETYLRPEDKEKLRLASNKLFLVGKM